MASITKHRPPPIRPLSLVMALLVVACADSGPTTPEGTRALEGTVHTLDGGPAAPLRVIVEAAGYRQQAPVDGDGHFALAVPDDTAYTLTVREERLPPERYLPSMKEIPPAAEGPIRVLMVPTRWTIDGGAFDGLTVPVRLNTIYDPEGGVSPYWSVREWKSELLESDAGVGLDLNTAAWPREELPVPLYFERSRFGTVDPDDLRPISAQDSVVFWEIVNDFERRLGIDAFRPARKEEIPIDSVIVGAAVQPTLRPSSVQYSVIPTISNAGGSRHACSHFSPAETCERFGPGTLLAGTVNTVAIQEHPVWDTLRLEFYLQHELLHVLGVGHACWAPSVMSLCRENAVVGYRQEFSDKVTSLDAGYLQLYLALHEKLLDVRPHLGLHAALNGERSVLLEEEPVEGKWWYGSGRSGGASIEPGIP